MTRTITRSGLERHVGDTVTVRRKCGEITGQLTDNRVIDNNGRVYWTDPLSFTVCYEKIQTVEVEPGWSKIEPLKQGDKIRIRYGPKESGEKGKFVQYRVNLR